MFNTWKDSKNPKGLWRKTTMTSYKSDNPEWETVLDIDIWQRRMASHGCGKEVLLSPRGSIQCQMMESALRVPYYPCQEEARTQRLLRNLI